VVATDVPNGRPDSTTSPSGAYTHGRVRTPSRSRRPASSSREASSVLARSVTGAGALLKRTHSSAASKPYLPSHRVANQAGCDQVMLRYSTGSDGPGMGRQVRFLLMRLRIALTAPAARVCPR